VSLQARPPAADTWGVVSRTSLALWGVILLVGAVLLLGAWLSLREIARAADTTPEPLPANSAAGVIPDEFTAYVAPARVCPGADDLGAPINAQIETELCLVNYARRVQGVPTLTTSPMLMRSASLKASDIVRCNHFSHEACGADVRRPFADSGYFAPTVDSRFGENLAWGGSEAGSPRGALLGWLDSPEHRANLLRADWAEQGLALVYVPNFRGIEDSRIWVSHFGRRG
jgi:uncharacterized protein YkwD